MSRNRLTLEVYQPFSTTVVPDIDHDLARADGVWFETFYPGGLYGSAGFSVAREPGRMWLFRQGQRLVMRSGGKVAYEGCILAPGQAQGRRTVEAAGYWGVPLLGTRILDKRFHDNRITDDIWTYQNVGDGATGAEKCTEDRRERIRFTPKAVAWADGEYAAVRYSMPYGEDIKHIVWSYDLQEAAQAWEISAWRFSLPNTWTQMTAGSGETYSQGTTTVIAASGTGTIAVSPTGTPRFIELRFYSRAAQTPATDGTIYGQFSSVFVYGELTPTPTNIVKSWISDISDLNSDVTHVGTNTQAMEPYITEGVNGFETAQSNLSRMATFGDSSNNPWSAYILESEQAATPNGKPVLALAQQLALSDYDYEMTLAEALAGGAELLRSTVYNRVMLTYLDERQRPLALTYSEDGSLIDTTSVAKYGARDHVFNGTFSSLAAATKAAQKFLAQNKDEHYFVDVPIRVTGTIRGKYGQAIPVSHVRAGKRLRISDVATDEVGVSGAGLTFLISHTHYDDPSETVAITCGTMGQLGPLLASFPGSASLGQVQPPRP